MRYFRKFPKDLFEQWTREHWYGYIHYLFYPYQLKIKTCYHISQGCCCPGNAQNFRNYWSIKCFRWYIAIRIGHAIDIKGKDISFIKQFSVKTRIMDFYWKVQKRGFTRIFIFLLEFQLIRINPNVIIF